MPLKLNTVTGLFEEVPDTPSEAPITSIPDNKPSSAIPPVTPVDPPTDPIPPVVEAKDIPTADPTHVVGHSNHKLTPKQVLYMEITNILREHDGLESNIPVNHDYWKKLNEYRSMR